MTSALRSEKYTFWLCKYVANAFHTEYCYPFKETLLAYKLSSNSETKTLEKTKHFSFHFQVGKATYNHGYAIWGWLPVPCKLQAIYSMRNFHFVIYRVIIYSSIPNIINGWIQTWETKKNYSVVLNLFASVVGFLNSRSQEFTHRVFSLFLSCLCTNWV